MSPSMKLRKTDQLFRKYALKFYGYTCARCGKKYSEDDCRGLHVSHYWSRRHEATRFSLENTCLLCYSCHMRWGHGEERDQYKEYMLKRLSKEDYDRLEAEAHTYKKRDDKMDEIILKELLK